MVTCELNTDPAIWSTGRPQGPRFSRIEPEHPGEGHLVRAQSPPRGHRLYLVCERCGIGWLYADPATFREAFTGIINEDTITRTLEES